MKIIFLRQAHKYIKNSDKPLKNRIKKEILKIIDNPHSWKKLSWKLKDVYSHRFVYKKVQYRVAYKVIDGIIVIAISTRENFYDKL